jgi:hypothetical protein
LFGFVATLLILGLAACGGDGGDGGGGGIPSATNAAITPPPATPVAIAPVGNGGMSTANVTIAANAFQAGGGAVSNATNLAGSVEAGNSGTQTRRETLAAIVRRHAEKIRDHHIEKLKDPSSVTSAVQVLTEPCTGGGTLTVAVDDATLSSTQVWVNCNEGGLVAHGTISSSNVQVSAPVLGSTPGSPYTLVVSATTAIDFSLSTTAPVSTFVTQGLFTFTTTFSGTMQTAPGGGVEPGDPTQAVITITGSNLLTSDGTVRERLSNNFSITVDETLASTTTSGHYTYASTIINGSVDVSITSPFVTPQGALHPTSGEITITGSVGKIVLTVISSPIVGVRVDVFANAGDVSPIDSAALTWAAIDSL